MAITSIKSTYALDAETVALLDMLARQWGVSKSEALRRAIRASATQSISDKENPLAVWKEFQARYSITSSQAQAWADEVRAERRHSSDKLRSKKK